MKTRILKPIILIVMLLSTGMLLIAQPDKDLRTKIEKINDELANAMVSGDLEKNLKYYTADAITMPDKAAIAEGIDAIKKTNQKIVDSGIKIKSCDFTTLQVNSYGRLVTEVGSFILTYTMPDQMNPIEYKGKYLNIWEKQADGSFKIKIEIWNTDELSVM